MQLTSTAPKTTSINFPKSSENLCSYYNSTLKMQRVRMVNSEDCGWETTLLPQQKLLFGAIRGRKIGSFLRKKRKCKYWKKFFTAMIYQCNE
ncbi:MAG: DUF1830 domain-containing protein, partial [Hydrococcus sp. SU_1_0]|nr:DUF1830 domain-containing protein [Hydrococcus sp. SU_1_0]